MSDLPPLAVIIPTLNEASTLPRLLKDLAAQIGVRLQVWISDGGSHDDTVAHARAAGASIASGSVGRGAQMNQGHQLAPPGMRLFLHADSRLTRRDQLVRALRHWQAAGGRGQVGHFPLQFHDAPAEHAALFRFMEAKTRSGRPGTIHGDQGVLVHGDDFDRLGRFTTRRPYFEDVTFSEAVFADAAWCCLPDPLQTSARRFLREGVKKRYALMGLMMALHATGDEAFLDRMPELYRAQSHTAQLAIWPFWRAAAWRVLQRPQAWPRLVRYGWGQRWQLQLIRQLRNRSKGPP